MTGGLVVLGFLLLAFVFRSAIVGDLAPIANARAPTPRARLPPPPASARVPVRPLPPKPFAAGREAGRGAPPTLEGAFETLLMHGADARLLESDGARKRVRLYQCLTCQHGRHAGGCEHERGLLAGAFEAMTGDLAIAEEVACRGRGDEHCEFEVRHAPLRRPA